MALAIAELRQRFQTLYDVQGSAVLDSTDGGEVDQLINDGYRGLWAEVTGVNKDFRVTVLNFTIATGQTQALPADFREVRTVRRDPGTTSQIYLTKFGPKSAGNIYDRTYRLQGSSLYIEPLARAPGSYALDYIPQVGKLADATPNVDVELEPFQDFIVYVAVIEAFSREESDASQYLDLLAQARARVRRWAADQRSADPDVPEDVRRSTPWIWSPP